MKVYHYIPANQPHKDRRAQLEALLADGWELHEESTEGLLTAPDGKPLLPAKLSVVKDICRVRPGIYQHHKGALYTVIDVSLESTNGRPREFLIQYQSHKTGQKNSRVESEFCEEVLWAGDQVRRPRFARIVPNAGMEMVLA